MLNNIDRAKQFLPFDALKGFREALKEKEKNIELKKDLFDNEIDKLNEIIKKLRKDMLVKISYYYSIEYIEIVGKIKMIDIINKKINILNSVINFDDIVSIEII